MSHILDKKPVNTSRQGEFDYLKGFFMVFIFLVHAYQATSSHEDIVIKIVYGFAIGRGYIYLCHGYGHSIQQAVRTKDACKKRYCNDSIPIFEQYSLSCRPAPAVSVRQEHT